MTPDDIRQLRKVLRCTPDELAHALGVDRETIMDWEGEKGFPTKRFVKEMDALRDAGPEAIVRRRHRKGVEVHPLTALADPAMWTLMRKLLAHPQLRADVVALSKSYDDPCPPK